MNKKKATKSENERRGTLELQERWRLPESFLPESLRRKHKLSADFHRDSGIKQ